MGLVDGDGGADDGDGGDGGALMVVQKYFELDRDGNGLWEVEALLVP